MMGSWFRECVGSLGRVLTEFPDGCQLPLREWVNPVVTSVTRTLGPLFDSLTGQMLFVLRQVETVLLWLPWWLVIAAICLVVWQATRQMWFSLGMAVALVIIGMFDLWDDAMRTLAIMLISTVLTVLIGIPAGILMATSRPVRAVISPILDGMQTMPSFVYLIPFVFIFGLGNVAAIFAVCIYSVPPLIRLTNHGIRLVDPDTVEAADAFGATGRQVLWGVRIPLAVPTIMAGVNLAIMAALSMTVIASMIGARGLGQPVLRGVNNGDTGMGLEAGLAVVALAIILDRVTAAYGRRLDPTQPARA